MLMVKVVSTRNFEEPELVLEMYGWGMEGLRAAEMARERALVKHRLVNNAIEAARSREAKKRKKGGKSGK